MSRIQTLILGVVFLGAGAVGGLLVSSRYAGATNPGLDASVSNPTTFYDEQWSASQAYALIGGSYTPIYPDGSGVMSATVANAAAATTFSVVTSVRPTTTTTAVSVSAAPKLIVTQWTVKGHIHFL